MLKQLLGIALVMLLTVGAMAAGAAIYKWSTATPTQTAIGEAIPVTPTANSTNYQNLDDKLIRKLLEQYRDGEEVPPGHCLGKPIDFNVTWGYMRITDEWVARAAGEGCQGVELIIIDDGTGEIRHLRPVVK